MNKSLELQIYEAKSGCCSLEDVCGTCATLDACKDEIQRLEGELAKAREYVHLTDYEITKAINYILVHEHFMKQLRALEQAIIARQNLIVVESKP